MTLMSIYNIGWMGSLGDPDGLLQTFFSDNYLLETGIVDVYLAEDGAFYVQETNTVDTGDLLKSDGGRLLLS